MKGAVGRDGFTLLEIVIAVAIIAVMAGAAAPLVFRQLEAAREDATRGELDALRGGLLEFYEDTGRLPTEAEGLTALAVDPGVAGWSGPYVGAQGNDPVAGITRDAWQQDYFYDLAPTTSPAGAADAIVASAGTDRALTIGSVGGTWNTTATADDLLALAVIGPVDRTKLRECEAELAALAAAGQQYFADRAAFPAGTADLAGSYLDAGLNNAAFSDPWRNNYSLVINHGGTNPPNWIVRSRGPNRIDESGGGDDLTIVVTSEVAGRGTTLDRVRVAQSVLNGAPALALTGNWTGSDRAALGLAAPYDVDGWGRAIQINAASRTVYSAGPDGNAATTADNIPIGMGP